jgi:eukaryotic-like serine/threonine-protein kinase
MKNIDPDSQHRPTPRRRGETTIAIAILILLVGSLVVFVNIIHHHNSSTASPSHARTVRTAHTAHADASSLYVGGGLGELYKLDTETGKLLWRFQTTARTIPAPATVAGNDVYFGDSDGNVYALNADTGKQVWTFSTEGSIVGSPTVDGPTVYLGSADSHLYALNAQTGAKVWSYDPGQGNETVTVTSATVVNGVVYASASDEATHTYVFAVNAQTGAQVWRIQVNGVLLSAPQVSQGKVYAVSSPISKQAATTSQIVVFNAANGSQPTQPTQEAVAPGTQAAPLAPPSPTIVNGTVYFGSQDGTVSAVSAGTAAVLWHQNVGGAVDSSPVVTQALIYVGVSTGTIDNNAIMALNPADGTPRWTSQLSHYAGSNIVVSGNVLFVGTQTATVYALDATSGLVLWSYQEPAPFSNTPLTAA